MRVPAPADALRVARALLMLSQREASEGARIVQKSVSAAETSKSILLETNLSLVDFYSSRGILFLGAGTVGEEVARCGARWIGPDGPAEDIDYSAFHGEESDVSFRAARALLHITQAEVAAAANIKLDVVKGLENDARAPGLRQELKEWYQRQGIEFTGWGNVSTGKFYGVGVRWKLAGT